eukprot:gene24729-63774_t
MAAQRAGGRPAMDTDTQYLQSLGMPKLVEGLVQRLLRAQAAESGDELRLLREQLAELRRAQGQPAGQQADAASPSPPPPRPRPPSGESPLNPKGAGCPSRPKEDGPAVGLGHHDGSRPRAEDSASDVRPIAHFGGA